MPSPRNCCYDHGPIPYPVIIDYHQGKRPRSCVATWHLGAVEMAIVELLRYGKHTVARLRDQDADTQALVHCTYGFNLYSWQVRFRNRTYDLLKSEDHFGEHPRSPSGNGTPLLFPFPNRIAGGRFRWGNKTYQLERNERGINAIHGFVLDRPWSVRIDETGRLQGVFQLSRHAPSLLQRWPSDFRLTCAIRLSGTNIEFVFRVANVGNEPLPWGLGMHPYFRLPLGLPGDENQCFVQVPAGAIWELEQFLPTGRVLPVPGELDLRKPRRLSELRLDHVYTDLEFVDNWCTCRLEDRALGLCVTVKFDSIFREVVVYTPPTRGSVCIEPYTCATNAINLHTANIDAGLRVLEPGKETYAGTILFQIG